MNLNYNPWKIKFSSSSSLSGSPHPALSVSFNESVSLPTPPPPLPIPHPSPTDALYGRSQGDPARPTDIPVPREASGLLTPVTPKSPPLCQHVSPVWQRATSGRLKHDNPPPHPPHTHTHSFGSPPPPPPPLDSPPPPSFPDGTICLLMLTESCVLSLLCTLTLESKARGVKTLGRKEDFLLHIFFFFLTSHNSHYITPR